MKKFLKILSIFTFTASASGSVIACSNKPNPDIKPKSNDEKIINELKNRDYAQFDVEVNTKVSSIFKELSGQYFKQYLSSDLILNYQPAKFKVISIVKANNPNQEISDEDFKGVTVIDTLINFSYNDSLPNQFHFKFNIKLSLDSEISEKISSYQNYKIKVKKGAEISDVLTQLQNEAFIKNALIDPNLLDKFNFKNFKILKILNSDGKEIEDWEFQESNENLVLNFSFKYGNESEAQTRLQVIVLYGDDDFQSQISLIKNYAVTFHQIKSIDDENKALKEIFGQITPEKIVEKLSPGTKNQIDASKIKIDTTKLLESNISHAEEKNYAFLTTDDKGNYQAATFYVLFSYNNVIPEKGKYQETNFIKVKWNKIINSNSQQHLN